MIPASTKQIPIPAAIPENGKPVKDGQVKTTQIGTFSQPPAGVFDKPGDPDPNTNDGRGKPLGADDAENGMKP